MAQDEAPAEAQAPKKKGKLLIIIIAAVLVLVIGGGAAAYLLLSGGDKKSKKHAGDEEAAAEEGGGEEGGGDEHPPVYQKLDTFTVNLAGQDSYLQTEIQLKLADAKVGEKLNAHMPEIRDALIRLLSKKTPEELNAPDGKDKLAEEVNASVNEVLGVKKKSQGVKKVLFVAFIIQ
jgi:flagellar FliL protein